MANIKGIAASALRGAVAGGAIGAAGKAAQSLFDKYKQQQMGPKQPLPSILREFQGKYQTQPGITQRPMPRPMPMNPIQPLPKPVPMPRPLPRTRPGQPAPKRGLTPAELEKLKKMLKAAGIGAGAGAGVGATVSMLGNKMLK